jgi:hypothetical protein
MRIISAMFLCLLLSGVACSQKTSTPEEAIGRIITLGLLEGHDQKVIGGMGDAAAVVVTKVVGDKKLTASQIDSVLVILNSAFAGIEPPPNREPKTALFVLQFLELSTKDPQLIKKIVDTRHYIVEQFAKSKEQPRQ